MSSSVSPARARRQFSLSYYEARLADLLERVREGFTRYDAGELNAFDLDARTLEEMQAHGESIDWWDRGNPPRND